jgi:hypothetical protein
MHKLSIAIITALSLVALPAHADRGYERGGYGHHRGGGGGGNAWAGLAIIGAIAGLAIMAEHSRPVYVESPTYAAPPVYAVPAPAASENWYYCQSSATYYPYTNACPEGWQVVPARPY